MSPAMIGYWGAMTAIGLVMGSRLANKGWLTAGLCLVADVGLFTLRFAGHCS